VALRFQQLKKQKFNRRSKEWNEKIEEMFREFSLRILSDPDKRNINLRVSALAALDFELVEYITNLNTNHVSDKVHEGSVSTITSLQG
jgi:hypothetical protein